MKRKERLQRVAELTSALLDGTLDRNGKLELNNHLRGDPDACERYLDLSEAHAALLHDHVGDELLTDLPHEDYASASKENVARFPSAFPFRWPSIAAAAAILLLLNGSLLFWLNSNAPEEPQADSDWVAVLSRTVEPVWDEETGPAAEGEALAPGKFLLRSGLAHIEFFSGASVIVEGPAELHLKSAWLVECFQGRLRTFVPEPAQGFTIVTPDYHAVDLGTEFALSVGSDGRSELHVVDGEVRLDDAVGNELHRLETGGGIRAQNGEFESIEGGGSEFVDRQKLLGLAEADWQSRYRSWESARDALISDPATLALFDFENQKPWDRQLDNRLSEGPNGAIIGAQWTQGRWPGKGAMEFKRITDRIRVNIAGEFDELTFSAWVRVEGLDRWLSSLLLTDGWDPGEVHWQISDQGELILGIKTDKGSPNSTSPSVIHPDDLGRWIHLAVTANRKSGRVVHFLDGEAVAIDHRDDLPKFRIGGAEIGNWAPGVKSHPIRSLNGRVDEFAILQRALSGSEIRAMYEAGR